jgi:hypothetical protein
MSDSVLWGMSLSLIGCLAATVFVPALAIEVPLSLAIGMAAGLGWVIGRSYGRLHDDGTGPAA